MVKFERHEFGPRLYVLGVRVHEVALGLVLLGVLALFGGTDHWEVTRSFEAVLGVGSWLVVKDWRDLFPSKRNTASWSLLLHRVKA